jgi:hypothetical protein
VGMTKSRKRRRATYVLVSWEPLLQPTTLFVGGTRTEKHCRVAVVDGDVLQWVNAQNRFRTRLAVASQSTVHGYWLPARFVFDTSHARLVVDVDLVAHTTPQQHARQVDLTRKALQAGDTKALARPATWSRLNVDDNDGSSVLHGMRLTDRHKLLVTQLVVQPLPNTPGRRGQHALDRSLYVAPNDLLRQALKAAQFYGVLRPATRSANVGVLNARRQQGVTQSPQRAEVSLPTVERHQVVRDLCQAAPYGERTQVVMRHFGCAERTAAKYIKQSQIALGWGLAHERSKRQRKSTRKGNKA